MNRLMFAILLSCVLASPAMAVQTGDELPVISDLAVTGTTTVSASLAWTAPPRGDPTVPGIGLGELRYDLRYSGTDPASSPSREEWFDQALPVQPMQEPGIPGTQETREVEGLQQDKDYWFCIRVFSDDEEGALPPPKLGHTGVDNDFPAAVTDLAVTGTTWDSATLQWRAPREDGPAGGKVTRYEIGYSYEGTVTVTTWGRGGTTLADVGGLAPEEPGTTQSWRIVGLHPGVSVSFAIKAYDEVDNGTLSEPNPSAMTLGDVDDGSGGDAQGCISSSAGAGPALPAVLAVLAAAVLKRRVAALMILALAVIAAGDPPEEEDGGGPPLPSIGDLDVISSTEESITLKWTTPPTVTKAGVTVPPEEYDLRYSTVDPRGMPWADWHSAATRVLPMDLPKSAGGPDEKEVTGLSGDYWFAIITRYGTEWSPPSNFEPGETLADTIFPAEVGDLGTSDVTATSAVLMWTAPGDDDMEGGPVARYEIRLSEQGEITENNLGVEVVDPALGPLEPHTPQSATVRGLRPGTRYWFGLKAIDDANNGTLAADSPVIQTAIQVESASEGEESGCANSAAGATLPLPVLVAMILFLCTLQPRA